MPASADLHRVPDTLADLLTPIDGLELYEGNARRGSIDTICESLEANGQYRPVVANRRTMQVLAGNHTLQAARKLLGWTHLAVTWVDVDDQHAARIVLVDNRSNDVAGYDADALVDLLAGIDDLTGTGYSEADLDDLLVGDEPAAHTDPDDVPAPPKTKPVSAPGDVWLLGPHRVLCGDSTNTAAVLELLDGDLCDAVWTDPPYGVEYVGGTAEKLTIANDGKADLPDLLLGAFRTLVTACKPGAPVYVAHADTARIEFELALREAGLLLRQNLIWVKNSLVLGHSDYHYRHEPILEGQTPPLASVADADVSDTLTHEPLIYGFTPGGQGRLGRGGARWYGDNKQSTVLEVPKPPRNTEHPTMKPVELIRRMLDNSLPPRGLVLDLFGGSGSTMIAAHHQRARAALVELDPRYVDVICTRWQKHTGVIPINRATGAVVDFVKHYEAA